MATIAPDLRALLKRMNHRRPQAYVNIGSLDQLSFKESPLSNKGLKYHAHCFDENILVPAII